MQKEQVLHKHFLIFVANGENSNIRYTNDAATPGYQTEIPGCYFVVPGG